MTQPQEHIELNFFFKSNAELERSCASIAEKKSTEIHPAERIAIGTSIELNVNTNELLGDEHDDIVLLGICVAELDGGGYRVLFPELPSHSLFRVQPKKRQQFKPRPKPKQKVNPINVALQSWQKNQTVIVGTMALSLFIITASVFLKNSHASNAKHTMPPAWQQVYDAGNVTYYSQPTAQRTG